VLEIALVPLAFQAMFAEEVRRADMEPYALIIAAQIKHESNWNPDAESPVGAQGLSQIMPTTWQDLAPRLGSDCADKTAKDPRCAIRAQVLYLQDISGYVTSTSGATRPPTLVDELQIVLASYNAGMGWIKRERRECYGERRCRSGVWIDNVEEHCLRSPAACQETQHYVGRITNTALNAYLRG